jgi:hypothetical protein
MFNAVEIAQSMFWSSFEIFIVVILNITAQIFEVGILLYIIEMLSKVIFDRFECSLKATTCIIYSIHFKIIEIA